MKNIKKVLLILCCFKATIEAAPGKISYDSRIKIGICKNEIANIEDEIKQNEVDLTQKIIDLNSLPFSVNLSFLIAAAKRRTEVKNNALRERIREINYQISQFERE